MPICTIYIVSTGTQWCKHFYQTSVHKPIKYAEAPCCSPQHASQAPQATCQAPSLVLDEDGRTEQPRLIQGWDITFGI